MKKIFEIIGLFSLVCFSFFYTSEISTVIKGNDDIYKQIKDIEQQYKVEAIDALVEGNTIIPGVSGSEIDINKSYKKMKKINEFNDNLLVYKFIKPNISVKKMYDKYIISGNKNRSNVSLIFKVKDSDNIDTILSILNEHEVKANFFIDDYWFENNNDLITKLINNGHIVGSMGYLEKYDNDTLKWMNTIIKKFIKQNDTYCYSEIENIKSLNICSDNKSYTIRPNIIVKENPLIEIKKDLMNGSIISLEVNKTVEKQLPLVLDYIDSKGLDMINIESLIEE